MSRSRKASGWPYGLADEWQGHAAFFRQHACERLARAYERCALQLIDEFEKRDREALSLQQAARESDYSASHLGRLVSQGKIPNAGRPGAPRIARGDLPSKVVPQRPDFPDISRTQIVRSATGEV